MPPRRRLTAKRQPGVLEHANLSVCVSDRLMDAIAVDGPWNLVWNDKIHKTIRARDLLSRPLLEQFHPVAMAKAFCQESEFKAMARGAVLDFHFPAKSSASTALGPVTAQTVVRYCRELEKKALETFLQRHGLKIAELLQAPEPMDDSCLAFCPRCQAQFTFVDGECSDCGGIKLQAFTGSSRKAQPAVSG